VEQQEKGFDVNGSRIATMVGVIYGVTIIYTSIIIFFGIEAREEDLRLLQEEHRWTQVRHIVEDSHSSNDEEASCTLCPKLPGLACSTLASRCARRCPSLVPSGARLRFRLKAWLIFSTVQAVWFLLVNIAKMGTLCFMEDPAVDVDGEAIHVSCDDNTTECNPEAPALWAKVAVNCGTLEMWFVEWTIMVMVLFCLGLWTAWSFVDPMIHDLTGEVLEDDDDEDESE